MITYLQWYTLIGLIFSTSIFIAGVICEDSFDDTAKNAFFVWLLWPMFFILSIWFLLEYLFKQDYKL